ncbi:MAG: hypothetical protein RMY29_007175 [Nostoc sp. CreGUA01]|nr:hypothetical protein [Nostoc sp. CreGUA01]
MSAALDFFLKRQNLTAPYLAAQIEAIYSEAIAILTKLILF